jgi:hypothetical protein
VIAVGQRSRIRQAPVGVETSRCVACGRYYEVADSTQRFADMAENPLLVHNVIRAMATEHSADNPALLSKRVCDHCAQKRCEQVLDQNSWNDPNGTYALNPTEEQYGRFADTSGGTVVVRKNKTKEKNVTDVQETWDAPVTEDPSGGDASIGTPGTKVPTGAERAKLLAEQWPVGTVVKFDKSEFKGNYGEVTGQQERRGVTYTEVAVTRYTNGSEREGAARKTVLVREGSVTKVDEYPANPNEAKNDEAGEVDTPEE